VTCKQLPQREHSRARAVILYALFATVVNVWTRSSLALNETMMRSLSSLFPGSAASTLIGLLLNMNTLELLAEIATVLLIFALGFLLLAM
jgi:hypothetical protein